MRRFSMGLASFEMWAFKVESLGEKYQLRENYRIQPRSLLSLCRAVIWNYDDSFTRLPKDTGKIILAGFFLSLLSWKDATSRKLRVIRVSELSAAYSTKFSEKLKFYLQCFEKFFSERSYQRFGSFSLSHLWVINHQS